jgi:hypothetical protein
MKWPRPKTWWSSLLWVVVTYVLAADLLPNLLLVVINSSGYLPYSDRPGPGWQRSHFPSKDELEFFFGFALLLLRGTAFYGGLFALLAGLVGVCRVPRWALRLIGTPLAFVSSGIMMAAAGWMIAISSVGIYTAAVCGGIWGLLIFPRLVPRFSYTLPLAVRIIAPLLIFAVAGYWLIRPLLPNRALTNAKVEVIRRSASEGAPLTLDYLGPGFAGNLKDANAYASVSRLEFATDGKNQVRALMIVDDPQPVAHTFVLPRTGTVVYRQSHGVWKEEQSGGKPSAISVTLTASFNSGLQTQGPCCSYTSFSFAPYH